VRDALRNVKRACLIASPREPREPIHTPKVSQTNPRSGRGSARDAHEAAILLQLMGGHWRAPRSRHRFRPVLRLITCPAGAGRTRSGRGAGRHEPRHFQTGREAQRRPEAVRYTGRTSPSATPFGPEASQRHAVDLEHRITLHDVRSVLGTASLKRSMTDAVYPRFSGRA
jgi:hypothetical protein